jgi:hypothetical protein
MYLRTHCSEKARQDTIFGNYKLFLEFWIHMVYEGIFIVEGEYIIDPGAFASCFAYAHVLCVLSELSGEVVDLPSDFFAAPELGSRQVKVTSGQVVFEVNWINNSGLFDV